MSFVELKNVVKQYGTARAVDGVNLSVNKGELVSLLGPSGCGKTTTLRMIAGFVEVSSGKVLIADRDVTGQPVRKRNIGFGFQNYALFPHMSVLDNVGYGLKMRGVDKASIAKRAQLALEKVQLGAMGARYPKQLSGGQQQRVALARALVIEPDVLLLDEPLSNLDAQLRHQMKAVIRNLQREFAITTIFVTHDQDEALTISDRIVVMDKGRIEQQGAPHEVFSNPATSFVAEFMGFGNLPQGEMQDGGAFRFATGELASLGIAAPKGVGRLAVRPQSLRLSNAGEGLTVKIVDQSYRGNTFDYEVTTAGGQNFVANLPVAAATELRVGDQAKLTFAPEGLRFLPA